MRESVEESVANFYNARGWIERDGSTTDDALLWEDLRECAREYVSYCRRRVALHIPKQGRFFLDVGSGPIQYPEYLDYSRGYEKRYCIDLSATALSRAAEKIGDHGVFINQSIFDADLPEDYFDCCVSLHVIYHIEKARQEEAVLKLLRVTKRGCPVVIVYFNPDSFGPLRTVLRRNAKNCNDLYFQPHPLSWWDRFDDVADIQVFLWRSFTASDQKRLFPNNRLGSWMFRRLVAIEEKHQRLMIRLFRYPMIVLKRR
jgi:SAM-dependent methyltransferase